MNNYSEIKKTILNDLEENKREIYSYLTHYLHNKSYDESLVLNEPIGKYFSHPNQLKFPIKWDIPFPPPKNPKFRFIDLFCGIGGFRIGLQELGGRCVFSSDINHHASTVYENNFGEYPFGDITKINKNEIPDHEILTAGFPCQPFSISGLKKGFEDTRGTLIYDVFKIIQLKKPNIVMLENVKHLIHHDKGNTFKTIIMHMEKLGYRTSYEVLNANNYGLPQNRERLIIVGCRNKKFDFKKIPRSNHVQLKEILDKDANFEYLNKNEYTLIESPKKQLSGLIFCGYRNKKIRKAGVRPNTEHLSRVHKQPNRIYSTQGTHPTIPSQETAGRFWIYHEGKVRKLTVNECYKIMGFPNRFVKSNIQGEQYKQIGNSVAIPMIKAIGKEIIIQLMQKQL